MTAKQVLYSGRVQGVGFRYSVKQIASGYEVTGFVRNLPDGRVELQAAARETDELAEFLAAIQESNLGSLIRDFETHALPAPSGWRGFTIEK